jgi:hypothetical protein
VTDRPADNRDARKKSQNLHQEQIPEQPGESGTSGVPAKPRRTRSATPKPKRGQPANAQSVPGESLTGVVGDASASGTRSGEDVRKRGWFWHWNSIVTQYAPLIGLKGVGLLNSYTVWTDRREESPHRGFAFPSQQSEADFYGEDRAELITINKILVALDLIEIRKEMVLRVDAQGRRWKVPHNLYRVKDHGDDVSLTTQDVLRVIELAETDKTVYRYLRRLFSPRFSPIDGDNVWHRILPEVRATETWQRLAERTERDETKASARSKAGHAARPKASRERDSSPVFSLPDSDDNATSEMTAPDTDNDSDTVGWGDGGADLETSVEPSNTGFSIDDAPINSGSGGFTASSGRPTNKGGHTSVGPDNTTYNQSKTTTTKSDSDVEEAGVRTEQPLATDRFGSEIAPDTTRSQTQTIRAFEEANDRKASAAERRQLRQLAEWVTTAGFSDAYDAWRIVTSAIEEAVAAGSSFVAPKRVREILSRWSRDGVPTEYVAGVRIPGGVVTGNEGTSHRSLTDASDTFQLPNGKSGVDVWDAVEQAVRPGLGVARTRELFTGTAVVGYDAGEVTIQVPTASQHEGFAVTHRELVARKLGSALRRPVRLVVIVAAEDPDPDPVTDAGATGTQQAAVPPRRRELTSRPTSHVQTLGAMPVFTIERCGMTNRQVWALALTDLREGGVVPRHDVEAWLRDVVILAVDEDAGSGSIDVRLGVPHLLAGRRIEGRFLPAIRQTLARLLVTSGGGGGGEIVIDVALTRDWLQETA